MKNTFLAIFALVLISACSKSSTEEKANEATPPAGMAGSHHSTMTPDEQALAEAQKHRKIFRGKVEEAIYKEGFAYVRLDANSESIWVAVVNQKPVVGDQIAVQEQAVLTDFHSKSLDRTFPKIIFGAIVK